jgi:hypothetical protein
MRFTECFVCIYGTGHYRIEAFDTSSVCVFVGPLVANAEAI